LLKELKTAGLRPRSSPLPATREPPFHQLFEGRSNALRLTSRQTSSKCWFHSGRGKGDFDVFLPWDAAEVEWSLAGIRGKMVEAIAEFFSELQYGM